MIKRIFLIIVAALVLFSTVQTSQAVLSAVDPGPYNAKYGYFPIWYADSTATLPPVVGTNPGVLELCISQTVGPNGPMCVLLANPGVFDPALPVVFPLNFPDESFWFIADAILDNPATGVTGTYRAALEAAFAGGAVVNSDQISFARIRIRINLPTTAPAGNYTVIHPYGTNVFNVTTPGIKAINSTVDVGVGAPGVFTGALAGAIGPFLTRAATPGGTPTPIVIGTETFIGDPNIFQTVTGGLNGVNSVTVIDPNGVTLSTTNQFNLGGKIFDGELPTALAVDRSTYSRTATASRIDIFATSTTTARVSFRESLTTLTSFSMVGDDTGKLYGQDPAPAAIPSHVIVTATDPTAVPPTTPTPLASPLVDVVKITRAVYAQVTQTLTIEASSSDQVAIPILKALGFGTLSVVAPGPTQRLVVSPVVEPPARITVKSQNGGSDTEPVVILPAFNLPPVAVNDTATTNTNVPVTINVLANDTDPDGNLPLTVASVTQPPVTDGTVVNNGTSVTFTPVSTFLGTTTFTYQAADSLGALSNLATVSVTVSAPNQSPVAVNDGPVSTNQGVAVNINVLGNDSDPDGNTPLTVANLSPVSPAGAGTVVVNATTPQTVTYTPAATFFGTATFTYQARDSLGALSNTATVTVNVNDRPVAIDDSATTNQGVAVTINVVANDRDLIGGINPASVAIVTPPPATSGTVTNHGNGTVTFTPAAAFSGVASFTYTVADLTYGFVSNVATVTVNVNDNPVANNDSATTTQGVAVVINVVANDRDLIGGINPASVAIVTPPPTTSGTVTNNLNGTVTFTPVTAFSGVTTFTYTVRDTTGLLSNVATVTVTVNAIVETLTIKTAQYDSRKLQWNLNGSSSQRVGNTITLTLTNSTGIPKGLVATVPVGANGSWQYKGPGPAAVAGDRIQAKSTFGTIATSAVQVR